MRKNKYILGAFLVLAGSAFLLLKQPNAIDFKPLDTIGKESTININYMVDDTKGITNYAGVSKVQACVDCKEKLNLTYGMLVNGQYTTNNDRDVVQRVNKGGLTYWNYAIPVGTSDGKHWLCVQTEDDTAKTVDGNFQEGNVSTAKDNVSCKRFYHDTESPVGSKIVLNKNNRYTNSSLIPVTMTIEDNYAGLRNIKYDNGNGSQNIIPSSDISCQRNTKAGQNEGKWTCKVDTVINVNSDRADADISFLIEDKVGNASWTPKKNIRFDKVIPTGTVQIHEDGNGVVNSPIGYIEYHVKDAAKSPWIYPSGLVKVSVSEMDGSHEVVLLNDPDLTKDKKTSLDGMLDDYLLTTCDKGAMSVKLFVKDRAGNFTGDGINDEVVVSNSVVCSQSKVTRYDVTDVVNPAKYTESIPFSTLSWVFNDGDTPEGMSGGVLAPLLAGANSSFEFDVEWTGDINAVATANYVIEVKNAKEKYERSLNGSLNGSSFVMGANGKKYSTFKDTVAMPKDAPTGSLVTIKVNVTITSIEGGKDKVTKSSALFDKNGKNALWGEIFGSIDDYLWFGEIN